MRYAPFVEICEAGRSVEDLSVQTKTCQSIVDESQKAEYLVRTRRCLTSVSGFVRSKYSVTFPSGRNGEMNQNRPSLEFTSNATRGRMLGWSRFDQTRSSRANACEKFGIGVIAISGCDVSLTISTLSRFSLFPVGRSSFIATAKPQPSIVALRTSP